MRTVFDQCAEPTHPALGDVVLGLQGREEELTFYFLLMALLYNGARECGRYKCSLKCTVIPKLAKLDVRMMELRK
jgi:hypothetical protein